MGIDLPYAKGDERWRYERLGVYDGNTPIDISIGWGSDHAKDILDENVEVLSCSR